MKNKKLTKKTLLKAIIVIFISLLVLYVITLALPYIFKPKEIDGQQDATINFDFYPADYSEDIFKDEQYLTLIEDGILEYDDNASMISSVTPENAREHGDSVKLIVDMVYSAIHGDAETYNRYFSNKYYENNAPKEAFTKQKIYNGRITFFSSSTVAENGTSYSVYEYKLTYNIYENNGTFRKDIGDGAKTQCVVITDREGKLLIDSIAALQYK